ncbi:hypothetical protein SKAU_G00327240 [Synaphobranchus kaupii]|uniref:Uncharacterized protein n=1 Tax=Synaphobranchus kaupii TaxID=118154 RepID=A0A9Q1IKD4_SYNKA|nr:hypothetical protein SKAU_G00327240 [Synaphobranchus kaupii]
MKQRLRMYAVAPPSPPFKSPDRRSASIYFPRPPRRSSIKSRPEVMRLPLALNGPPPPPLLRRYLPQQIANYPGEAGKRYEPALDGPPLIILRGVLFHVRHEEKLAQPKETKQGEEVVSAPESHGADFWFHTLLWQRFGVAKDHQSTSTKKSTGASGRLNHTHMNEPNLVLHENHFAEDNAIAQCFRLPSTPPKLNQHQGCVSSRAVNCWPFN